MLHSMMWLIDCVHALSPLVTLTTPGNQVCPYACTTKSCHSFSSGEKETLHAKLKSILAQLEYTYQVRSWQSKGVPFDMAMYVPENHPESGDVFYEHEDAAHLLKVYT